MEQMQNRHEGESTSSRFPSPRDLFHVMSMIEAVEKKLSIPPGSMMAGLFVSPSQLQQDEKNFTGRLIETVCTDEHLATQYGREVLMLLAGVLSTTEGFQNVGGNLREFLARKLSPSTEEPVRETRAAIAERVLMRGDGVSPTDSSRS